MDLSTQQLPDSIDELKEIIVSKSKTIDFFQLRIQFLEEKNRYLRSKLFGRKSEKHIDIDDTQLQLFDELEEIVEQELPEEETIIIPSHKRKKTGRKPLPQNLPRVDVIHDLSDEEKVCTCGCAMDMCRQMRIQAMMLLAGKPVSFLLDAGHTYAENL